MPSRSPLLVACLCAAWCKTCDEYRRVFVDAARTHPDARFIWVDIEEHSDLLGEDVDIENFPTLALLRGDSIEFLGTVLPHAQTLARMLSASAAGGLVLREPSEAQVSIAAAVHQVALELPAL